MKLVNHESTPEFSLDSNVLVISDSLRETEDNFYKLFDLNPCPISISDVVTHRIIDVNDAFLKVVGFKSKNDVIGHLGNGPESTLKPKCLEDIKNEIEEKGELKNYFCVFTTVTGKRVNGMFNDSIIELSGRKCLFLICQVITPGCVAKVVGKLFKTSLIF